MSHQNTKLVLIIVILCFIIGVLPTAFGETIYDVLPFGGKVTVQGSANVTTNATTNVSYGSATLNGYLINDGSLPTTIWFEYGKTIAYGTNTTPLSTYIYGVGATTQKIYQFLRTTLTKNAESTTYGNTIRVIAEDDTYIYVAGTGQTVSQYYKSTLTKKAETASYGGTIYALTVDDSYVYAGGATTQKIYKYSKADMSKVDESNNYGGTIYALSISGNYIYAGGSITNRLYEYLKSDMSYIRPSSNYGSSVYTIAQDTNYFYIGGGPTTFHVYKLRKTTLFIDDTFEYFGTIQSIVLDDTYVYIAGNRGEVWQYWNSNATLKAMTDDCGGTIYSIIEENNYIYTAGSGTDKIYKYQKSDMSKILESDSYGGTIYSILLSYDIYSTREKFLYNLNELMPDTTYHYRAVANNSNGTTYGSDQTFKTLSALSSNNTTSADLTTATANGYLYYDVGENTEVGFWIGNTTTNKTSFEQNITVTGTKNSNEAFSKAITGLTSGEYYYVRSWMNNSNGFWNATNESYFITKPNPPTDLTKVNSSYQQIGLRWENATVGDGTNRTTVIVYKTGGYPSNPADGTVGYNDTGNNTLITGLSLDTTYYFSAWTYVNDSGSPLLGAFSPSFATASGDTAGGIYNITIRYENNLTLVADTTMANLNHTCVARLRTGQTLNTTYPDINPFPMNCTTTPDVLFFDFKNLTLRRAITPEEGERELVFYVSDRPEYETGLNASECQLWYTFSFSDYTNYFTSSNQSKLYIYKFNGTEKYYIHQDYWSAEDTVDASLQYGDRYWLGVWCPDLYIPLLQYFDAHETTEPTIYISELYLDNNSIYSFVTVNFSWDGGGNGLWVNYTDSVFETNSFTIRIYETWTLNGTKSIRNTTTWTLDQKDFHWTIADGCNNSSIYYVQVEIDHQRFTTNQTVSGLYIPYMSAMTNPIWINDWFDLILGDSPFVDTDPDSSTYGESLSWTHIIAFGACLFLLMTIGHINMPLTMIGVGSLLIVVEISLGIVITRSFIGTTVGILGGIFLVVLGFIVALGGQKR